MRPLPKLEGLIGKMPTVKTFVVATEPGLEGWETTLPNAIDYEDFIAGKLTCYDWPEIDRIPPWACATPAAPRGSRRG